jgi:glucans biosynthesis protein C
MSNTEVSKQRLYFIDVARVGALAVLIVYHSGLIFAHGSGYHIRNGELSAGLSHALFFFHEWRLALLFFVSGVGTAFAFARRSTGGFARERLGRLLIPLLFGVAVVVPPQVYIERLYNGFDYGGWWAFYRQSFTNGLYPAGDLSWHHLWFVAYLLVYALLSVPLFRFWTNRPGLNETLSDLTKKYGLLVWALPLIAIMAVLRKHFPGVQNIVQDGAFFLFYWCIFIFGFLMQRGNLWAILEKQRAKTTVWALICMVAVYLFRMAFGSARPAPPGVYEAFAALRAFNCWCWILAICAWAKFGCAFWAKRSAGRHFLETKLPQLNRAVYPIYILHQTAILLLGYWAIGQNWPWFLKYTFVVAGTFALCWLFYRLLILPFRLARLVFGVTA